MSARVYRRIPSHKTLTVAFGADAGKRLRAVLDGSINPETIAETANWVRSCYNHPRLSELQENACNAILNGFGCEAITADGEWRSYYCDIVAGYVNLGDAYATTLLFDYDRNAVLVTSWGDWVESQERSKRYAFS